MKTKIVASIGPKSNNPEMVKKLIQNGADIFRFNFSHATKEEFLNGHRLIRKYARELKNPDIKIMADLQGPRIRVGELPKDGLEIKEGKTYQFSHTTKTNPAKNIIHIDDPYLNIDIKAGDPFFIIGGEIELSVTKVKNGDIFAKAVIGGILFSRKGINVPKTVLSRGGLTPKDIRDVKFALTKGIDYIALSFVQGPEDINKLRKVLGPKNKKIKLIAKIEREVALRNIDDIIQVADGIMVARGDLGIEIPAEDVPIMQKHLIRQAHWHRKPVIVATQMMTSMINHPHPTRAEVNDIATATFDRADAVMLSDETANGSYPDRAVAMMNKIILRTEEFIHKPNFFNTI